LGRSQEGLCFFVGPESGFSSVEKKHLLHLEAEGVRLHPHTLRANTASLVALSIAYASSIR
jgi:16S rRNA (uracil1498-N3)-methyltransferase